MIMSFMVVYHYHNVGDVNIDGLEILMKVARQPISRSCGRLTLMMSNQKGLAM